MYTRIENPPATRLAARAAALLVATLPFYVAFMVVAHTQMPEDTAADVTPDQLADMQVAWAIMHLLWAAPIILGCLGLWVLARRLPTSKVTGVARTLCLAGIAAMSAFYVVELALLGSDTATLGDSQLYAVGYLFSLVASWAAVIATGLLCRQLVSHRIAVRTAWSVLVLSALYLVVDLLTYLPVLFGSETLAETTAGMPPFLLGIFWAVLGAGLMRNRAPATS